MIVFLKLLMKGFAMTIATIARVAKITAAGVAGGVVGHDGVLLAVAGFKNRKARILAEQALSASATEGLDSEAVDTFMEAIKQGIEARAAKESMFTVLALKAVGINPFKNSDDKLRAEAELRGWM